MNREKIRTVGQNRKTSTGPNRRDADRTDIVHFLYVSISADTTEVYPSLRKYDNNTEQGNKRGNRKRSLMGSKLKLFRLVVPKLKKKAYELNQPRKYKPLLSFFQKRIKTAAENTKKKSGPNDP